MKGIPFANLFNSIEPIYDEFMEKIASLIKNTEFIGGPEVDLFEKEFAHWTESKYAIGTANGTDSLIIALKALGIGPGDIVLVPANSFIATSESVTMVGAEVDFVDVEPDYFTMDPNKVEDYLQSPKGKNVKAIIPVHLYGQMADMPRLLDLAKQYGFKIIEDSAQAHGSRLHGKQPGYYGDIATYSFYPGKNLGAFGDAGAITTNDEDFYKKCKMLVNHGRWKAKYEHEIEGYNMRLDTLQAAMLRIKLKYIDKWTAARKEKAVYYIQNLKNARSVVVPKIREGSDPVWHIFHVTTNNRIEVIEKLKQNKVDFGIHYPIPLHLQPAYKYKNYSNGDFPIAELNAEQELSLPIWPEISHQEIEFIGALF